MNLNRASLMIKIFFITKFSLSGISLSWARFLRSYISFASLVVTGDARSGRDYSGH